MFAKIWLNYEGTSAEVRNKIGEIYEVISQNGDVEISKLFEKYLKWNKYKEIVEEFGGKY